MPKLTIQIPAYRQHKADNRAVVSLGGRDIYLGTWNTSESREKYNRLIQEWLATGRQQALTGQVTKDIRVAELCLAFIEEAKKTYVKDGQPTGHLNNIERAVALISELYATNRVADFERLGLLVAAHESDAWGAMARTPANLFALFVGGSPIELEDGNGHVAEYKAAGQGLPPQIRPIPRPADLRDVIRRALSEAEPVDRERCKRYAAACRRLAQMIPVRELRPVENPAAENRPLAPSRQKAYDA